MRLFHRLSLWKKNRPSCTHSKRKRGRGSANHRTTSDHVTLSTNEKSQWTKWRPFYDIWMQRRRFLNTFCQIPDYRNNKKERHLNCYSKEIIINGKCEVTNKEINLNDFKIIFKKSFIQFSYFHYQLSMYNTYIGNITT